MSYEAWLRGDNVDASKTIFVATEMLAFDFDKCWSCLAPSGGSNIPTCQCQRIVQSAASWIYI